MDFDPSAVEAWARLDEGEQLVRYLLVELAKPALAAIREALGRSRDDADAAELKPYAASTPVVAWKNRFHLQYRVPAALEEERLRLQILASGGRPHFTVEARYNDLSVVSSRQREDPVAVATRALRGRGFSIDRDDVGYYWAAVVPAERWLYEGADTVEALVEHTSENVRLLAESGLFAALGELRQVSGDAGEMN